MIDMYMYMYISSGQTYLSDIRTHNQAMHVNQLHVLDKRLVLVKNHTMDAAKVAWLDKGYNDLSFESTPISASNS